MAQLHQVVTGPVINVHSKCKHQVSQRSQRAQRPQRAQRSQRAQRHSVFSMFFSPIKRVLSRFLTSL